MSSPLKKLLGQTAIYGVSSILGRAINFALIPIYTAVLSTSDYGVISELYAYVGFFFVLYLLGLETAYFRFSNKDGADEKDIFNSTQTTVLISSLIISGGLILLSTPIANILQIEGQEIFIIWLAIIMAIDSIVAIPFAQLRFYNQAKKYASIKMINIFLNVGINLFFYIFCRDIYNVDYLSELKPFVDKIYYPEFGAGYIILANLIANALYIPMLYKSFLNWKFSFNSEKVKPLLKYSYPLMFAAMAGIVNETLDRGFLKFLTPEGMYPGLSNQAVVGIYSACYKLSIFMSLGIQAFRYAAEPFFFSQAKDKKSPELFSTIMNWFVIVGLFVFLFISLNLDWIAPIVIRGESFRAGLAIVPILLLANLFLGMYYNLSIWFKLSEKTHWGTILAVIGAVITVVGNVALIPHIGYMGSAYTTLACYFMMVLVSYIAGQKHYPVPYQLFKIIRMIVIAVLLYYAGLQIDNFWYNLIMPIWFAGGMMFTERKP